MAWLRCSAFTASASACALTFASWVSSEVILASSAPGAGAVAIVLRIASDKRDTAVGTDRNFAAQLALAHQGGSRAVACRGRARTEDLA